MFIFLSLILCRIPVNKNIVISSLKDPQVHLVVYDKIVRLKYIIPNVYTPSDPNVLKAIAIKNKFRLKFADNSVYKKGKDPIISADDFNKSDDGFLFNINETPLGFHIITDDGKCFTQAELINDTEGNYVKAKDCDEENLEQLFQIRILENTYPGLQTQSVLGFKNKNMSDFASKEARSNKDLI